MAVDFVALDFETANSKRASACALGLVKVSGGKVVESKSFLMRPPAGFDDFDRRNISIHGITAKAVSKSPRFNEVWNEVESFVSGVPLVAHNASFDLSVLRAALLASNLEWPTLEYACSMVMSRQLFTLTSYSLPFVAHAAGVNFEEGQHHDALYDAMTCAQVTLKMCELKEANDLDSLIRALKLSYGELNPAGWEACRTRGNAARATINHETNLLAKDLHINVGADPFHPLYGKVVVFTGTLFSRTREDAWYEIAALGAIPSDSITRRTNILVVGQNDFSRLRPGDVQSLKFQKAEKLKESGQDIEVISEEDFISWLDPQMGGLQEL